MGERPPVRYLLLQMTSPARIEDRHGRIFSYLRVAVTERCNLRCVYCMPEEGVALQPAENVLTAEEIFRLLRATAALGVDKVRFTGGEPLVRHDLLTIVRGAAQTPGIERVALTTNGLALARRAEELRDAGLTGVNISLDTLQAERFEKITRRPGLAKVLAGLEQAVACGLPSVKLNMVVMRGFNDDEIGAFAALSERLPITVRFIELMPFDARQVWKTGRFLGADRIIAALHDAFTTLEPSEGSSTEEHAFRIPGAPGRVAVIPAYTRSLCRGCDRIRLTADGQLRNCLFSQHDWDLRGPLRAGASEAELGALVQAAMLAKQVDGWAAQREAEAEGAQDGEGGRLRTSMTEIGG